MAGEGMYCVWEPCGKLLPVASWDKSDFCSDECAENAMAEQARALGIDDVPLFGGPLRGDEALPAPPTGFSIVDDAEREVA